MMAPIHFVLLAAVVAIGFLNVAVGTFAGIVVVLIILFTTPAPKRPKNPFSGHGAPPDI